MQPENYFGKEAASDNLFPSHVKYVAIIGRFSYQQCPDKNSRHLGNLILYGDLRTTAEDSS